MGFCTNFSDSSFVLLDPLPLELCVSIPRTATLSELRRAVGAWPWRVGLIQAASGKEVSEEMTLLMALVTFDGYTLFGSHDPARSKEARDV